MTTTKDFDDAQKRGEEIFTATVTASDAAPPSGPRASEPDLEIPEFLVRRPGDKPKEHKPYAAPRNSDPVFDNSRAVADAPARGPSPQSVAGFAETEKAKKKAAIEKLRTTVAERQAIRDGMVWRNGKFVPHDALTRPQYDRIMRELPTLSMKRLFVHMYSEKVL